MTEQIINLHSTLSFLDTNIVNWKLSENSLELIVSQIYFCDGVHKNVKLEFPLLIPITSMYYDFGLNCWIDEKKIEPLKISINFISRWELTTR